MGCKCLMKWRSSCTACTCRHQGVARGQLQKSEVPDWLTGTASVTADHSDAAKRHLLDNYSRIVFAHTWCLAVMAKGDVFAVHRIIGVSRNALYKCTILTSQLCRGDDRIRVVESRWSVVLEPGQRTTLPPWYPLDGRLGLIHPNQSPSRVGKNRELWLLFFPQLMSQSETRTSLGQGLG